MANLIGYSIEFDKHDINRIRNFIIVMDLYEISLFQALKNEKYLFTDQT